MRYQKGFTIVELLIVIVVIAILASFSIVSYSGIQERSENTKTIQAATEWTKILASYAAIYGQYPTSTASPCLTQSGVSCGCTSGANNCFGVGTTASNVNYIQEINKVVTSLPSFSSQEISCNGATTGVFIQGYLQGQMRPYITFLRVTKTAVLQVLPFR
jgi:prepilin-type N-terminal cleavage/methylation domain-containing protein